MARKRETPRGSKNRFLAAVIAGGLAAAALAGCAGPEATEATTPSASPSAAPETLAEDTPTTEPSATSTQSPATSFAVDYESFADWENKTWVEKNVVCNEFFEANGANTGVTLTHQSSGEAIVNWTRARYEAAYTFNQADKSNEKDGAVASNLVECLTKQRISGKNDSKYMYGYMFESARGSQFELPMYELDHVTRYSQDQLFLPGTVAYTSEDGTFDGGVYTARVVEYVELTGLNAELITQEVFEWDLDTQQWHSVELHDKDAVLNYGATPVILDESRSDAPRQF